MTFIVVLLLLVVIVLLVFVIRIAMDVQAIRNETLHDIHTALRDIRSHERFGAATPIRMSAHSADPVHARLTDEDCAKVLWSWIGGEWIADVPHGINPGSPPDVPGDHEGQKARK